MKFLLKIVGFLLLAVVIAAAVGAGYMFLILPKSAAPEQITVTATPERVEHGAYLVNHVTGCVVCHSMRDKKIYSEPIIPGTEGEGSVFLSDPQFGTLTAPNITPTALKDWTDGEILRAMTAGVSRDGRPLFPIMPYDRFSTMSREDLYSIIAYIRQLKPLQSNLPATKLNFPLNLIVRTIPHPAEIREEATKNRGQYLTTIASCHECHTPDDGKGGMLPGMDFAGGRAFQHEDGSVVHSMNITPDNETGIGTWSREQFIGVFKRWEKSDLRQIPVEKGNTVMPWTVFAGMKEEDLGAIYDYLRTVKPVSQSVKPFNK